MAIASLISIPLAMLAYSGMFKNYKKNYDDYMETSNHMNSTIIEYVEGIEVIKAFNQS